MSIRRFLGLERAAPPRTEADTETVRRIVEALDRLDPARARFIAAFAYVLSRVAHVDLEISPDETRVMEDRVAAHGGLPRDQAILVVQMAKTQSLLFGGTENYLVTREFNRLATRDQKKDLLRCLFAVSAADRNVSLFEENEIRRIATELRLEHAEFIEARSEFRAHLAVLKKPEPEP